MAKKGLKKQGLERFNPLNRENSNQIQGAISTKRELEFLGFNPLNRGNSNQISYTNEETGEKHWGFQSPKSGKF